MTKGYNIVSKLCNIVALQPRQETVLTELLQVTNDIQMHLENLKKWMKPESVSREYVRVGYNNLVAKIEKIPVSHRGFKPFGCGSTIFRVCKNPV